MVHMVNQHIESIDIKFFINAKESCAYFEIYDLQFSFHNLYIPYSLGEFVDSEYNIIRPWKQVRLQRIAGELFRLSLRGRRH
jgi:hypothetical protein